MLSDPPKTLSPSGRSKTIDSFLGASEVLLTVLKDVSSFTSVPFMRDAAELCLGLLNTVQVSVHIFPTYTRR